MGCTIGIGGLATFGFGWTLGHHGWGRRATLTPAEAAAIVGPGYDCNLGSKVERGRRSVGLDTVGVAATAPAASTDYPDGLTKTRIPTARLTREFAAAVPRLGDVDARVRLVLGRGGECTSTRPFSGRSPAGG